ncbi:PD-(D/E)XK nuclease family protein (plasmid) [Flagellatimonas centrodinii]|uniref:PD-(D/E)XK nuclease family protein n=1 Tax=Flagellatimonas centrodinii TaxID=2806210 RepID=UPI001FEF5C01|nr:PD-(D/E)XK nuclease family protein [Flagellatimonas centrodinii]ULQ48377.1 PD-(D/E)XK nuclease family protein [Flagellatimonas centrodinii]
MTKLTRQMKAKAFSRSKLDLFMECPFCFWADIHHGVRRVSGPAFSLNIAVDALLKAEFDVHRRNQTPHPDFARVGLDAVPLRHAMMDEWRNNFTGVRWTDPVTGWALFGAIDDLWLNRVEWVVELADYKATSKAAEITTDTLYPGYRRQAEIYQFLLRRNGLKVSNRSWFYYGNGLKSRPGFGGVLQFDTVLLPYVGSDDWVESTFRAAVATATSPVPPEHGPDCQWCAMRAAAEALIWKPTPIALAASVDQLRAALAPPAPPAEGGKPRRRRKKAIPIEVELVVPPPVYREIPEEVVHGCESVSPRARGSLSPIPAPSAAGRAGGALRAAPAG